MICHQPVNLVMNPLERGGATTIANLQLLCGDCNREKGADL
jgi:5-methylcytosine-specific restriction endonuclease McrA